MKMRFPVDALHLLPMVTMLAASSGIRGVAASLPNIIIVQPDDLPFYKEWGSPPKNPIEPGDNQAVNLPLDILGEPLAPTLEMIREGGLQMMQAYASSPQCGTSRFSTMTGRVASRADSAIAFALATNLRNTKVQISTVKLGGEDCSSYNLAQAFSSHGYRTAMTGKWHLSKTEANETYEEHVAMVEECGFDYADAVYMENLFENAGIDTLHNLEWVTETAIKFMQNNYEGANSTRDDDPFFLYLNPTVPHGLVLESLESNCTSGTPAGDLDKEPKVAGMTVDADTGERVGCRKYRKSVIDRVGNNDEDTLGLVWVDDMIKSVMLELERSGKLNNTIIIFQEDHGTEAKSTLFEGGLRIPQFIYYPDYFDTETPDKKYYGPVSTIDIAPTLFEIAGITEDMDYHYATDGMSWASIVKEEDEDIVTDYIDNRCLVFEHISDRAILCGKCGKFISGSTTPTQAEKYGLVSNINMTNMTGAPQRFLFDLCNGTDEYVTDGISLEETTSSDFMVGKTLNSVKSCWIEKTQPSVEQDYETQCSTSRSFNACTDGIPGGVWVPQTHSSLSEYAIEFEKQETEDFNATIEGTPVVSGSIDHIWYPIDMVTNATCASVRAVELKYIELVLDNSFPNHKGLTVEIKQTLSDGTVYFGSLSIQGADGDVMTYSAPEGFATHFGDGDTLQIWQLIPKLPPQAPFLNPNTLFVEFGFDFVCEPDSTEMWLLNDNNETSMTIGGNPLVNIERVDVCDDRLTVTASGIPNYLTTITQELMDDLDSTPLVAVDFVNNSTSVSVGDVVPFAADIGYDTRSCEYGYWPPGPSCPEDQAKVITFPLAATGEAEPKCLIPRGKQGLFINGVDIYNWWDARTYASGVWHTIAPVIEKYGTDICHGHAGQGQYHHHSLSPCLEDLLGDDGSAHSPAVGLIADGHKVTSSRRLLAFL